MSHHISLGPTAAQQARALDKALARKRRAAELRPGQRVVIVGTHPHTGAIGQLCAYETYGLGWKGWRVLREDGHGEFYADPTNIRLVPSR